MADDSLDAAEGGTVDERVDAAIGENDVALFLKGTPDAPKCGFSKRAAALVTEHRPDAHTVNVLSDLDAYRAALEAHSGWETIPQAYVDGEFVGGSDVLSELAERGDLADELNADKADPDAEASGGVDAPF